MNLGTWIEENELNIVTPPDEPVTLYDGRRMNPYWCWQCGTVAYQVEIQLAPPAEPLAVV